jgi:hypothetical protein
LRDRALPDEAPQLPRLQCVSIALGMPLPLAALFAGHGPVAWRHVPEAAGANAMDVAKRGKPARPLLVWLISVGYGLVALGGVANTLLLATGILPVPEPHRSALSDLGALQWMPSLVGAFLMLAFCMALFRLRASAVRWCEALLLVSLATTGFQLARLGIPDGALGHVALATTAFSLGLLGAIYLYSRRLRSRGVLV